MPEKIALINLGCPKNLVDAEVMLGHLRAQGYDLTADASDADVVVVNTCGFLQASAQESVNTLLEAAERKGNGRLRAVVAAGCMTQRFGQDAADALPEVDGFLGVGQAHRLPELVSRVLGGERAAITTGPAAGFEGYGLRYQSTPSWTAYVKVSEGCDRNCAFCVIPKIRGEMVSRSVEAIAREVELLVAQGTREIVLIGQDPTRYGVDRGSHRMVELLHRLNEVRDLRWIRVMYLFPDRHVTPVLQAVAELPRVAKYVDMPFQHASRAVLRRMNRPGSAQEYLALLANLRKACPDVTVRSTFIVGFPGETDAEFAELCEFVEAAELDYMAAFRYSREENTTAHDLPEQVAARTIRERYQRLMALQQPITHRRLGRWIGREIEVLVEEVSEGSATGRAQGQAPEVDGEVRLRLDALAGEVRPGDFVLARVRDVETYDFVADAVSLLHRSPRRDPSLLQIA